MQVFWGAALGDLIRLLCLIMPCPGSTNRDVLYLSLEGDRWVLPGAVQGLCEYGVLSREEGPSPGDELSPGTIS